MSDLAKLEESIPALRRYAWALTRNGTEADDLVQDCLLRALDHFDTLTSKDGMRPWLFSIMHNVFVSRWRRHKLRAAVVTQDAEADAIVSASQEDNAALQDVLRGLETLPDDQKQVILLVAVEGFDYAEVSEILAIPIGTVMSRLSRGRDKMRDFMEGRDRPRLKRVK